MAEAGDGGDARAAAGLAVVPVAALSREPLDFSEAQRRLIRDSFANGASDAEFEVLIEIARARRLNPLMRQIHFVQRWDGDKGRPVWAAQVSIDGLRALAERTGLYAGQDEPEFVEHPDGTLKLCKVRVWRRDWPRPAVGIAYWDEYVQQIRDRQTGKQRPTAMWARMPHVMLAKCAESLALRKAFPEDMGGLYTSEEMGQSQNESPAVQHRRAYHQGLQEAAERVAEAHAPSPAPVVLPTPKRLVSATVAAQSVPVAEVAVVSMPAEVLGDGATAAAAKTGDPWFEYLG
ncbi:MAG: phage recombination protein Bet [Myxococcales bacterium]|nr:phage recombination protein Bet [Myxococcales bacterium]